MGKGKERARRFERRPPVWWTGALACELCPRGDEKPRGTRSEPTGQFGGRRRLPCGPTHEGDTHRLSAGVRCPLKPKAPPLVPLAFTRPQAPSAGRKRDDMNAAVTKKPRHQRVADDGARQDSPSAFIHEHGIGVQVS